MLEKNIKLHITCTETNIFGTCKYEWIGTEEEYNKILQYDGESLNHFPNHKKHKEYMFLKDGKCPFCEEFIVSKPRKIIRGGVIPSPQYNNRIPRKDIK